MGDWNSGPDSDFPEWLPLPLGEGRGEGSPNPNPNPTSFPTPSWLGLKKLKETDQKI